MSSTTATTDKEKNKITEELFEAAEKGNLSKIRQLIASGVDINKHMDTYMGKSVLSIAIEREDAPMVQYLIEQNAIVNYYYNTKTYLEMAIATGNTRIVELLLEAGADPNEIGYKDPPLFLAIKQNSLKLVEILCKFNANPYLKKLDGTSAVDLKMTTKMKEALDKCAAKDEKLHLTVSKIRKEIQQSISTRKTFPIQSQKTGQCYSDSFQHVLYFSDGIGEFFIDRAIERSVELKTEDGLPLERNTIAKKIKTPFDAANLYIDFTGIRFLDMFRKPMLLTSPSVKQKLPVRRKSIVSSISEQPLGIVCSQSLSVYEIVRSIFYNKATLHCNSNNKRVSCIKNIPETLNVEGYGFVFESAAFELWQTMLDLIPKEIGVGKIYGQTTGDPFKYLYYDSTRNRYRVPPKYVVGILVCVFPESLLRANPRVGHAISMVKVFNKWYVCDDNIGVALPVVGDFSVEELSDGSFIMDFKDNTISYGIRFPWKIRKWFADHPNEKVAPDSAYIQILASVPTKLMQTEKRYYEPDFGFGGHADLSISRKYITWQPAKKNTNTTKKANKNTKNKKNNWKKNKTLRALALKYKLISENEE